MMVAQIHWSPVSQPTLYKFIVLGSLVQCIINFEPQTETPKLAPSVEDLCISEYSSKYNSKAWKD